MDLKCRFFFQVKLYDEYISIVAKIWNHPISLKKKKKYFKGLIVLEISDI